MRKSKKHFEVTHGVKNSAKVQNSKHLISISRGKNKKQNDIFYNNSRRYNIYLFKFNNGNTKKSVKYTKTTSMTIVKFEYISLLVFLLLNLT